MIKLIQKTPEKAVFLSDMDISLANAIRRSINEVEILAIDTVDIYKNDSALYDHIIAHRIGLIPLKNQKIKQGKEISLKLQAQGGEVLSKEFGKDVVYEEIPIVLLEKEQELEVVAKARIGKGIEHAKFSPGILYYRHYNKIEISKEGEKHSELAELHPDIFEFDEKLKLKNEYASTLEEDDLKDYKGITIKPTEQLVVFIESWGQIDAEEIFTESVKAIEDNLKDLEKELK